MKQGDNMHREFIENNIFQQILNFIADRLILIHFPEN